MHTEIHLLQDIVIIFALASVVIWSFHRLKLPSIIGFLLTGMLAGPHALGLIKSVDEIEISNFITLLEDYTSASNEIYFS